MAVGLVGLYCFRVGFYCSNGTTDCTPCQQSCFVQKRIV